MLKALPAEGRQAGPFSLHIRLTDPKIGQFGDALSITWYVPEPNNPQILAGDSYL